jgi:site-specific DNA recombinase
MTGSHSKGKMRMRYAYYHCNHCGQERYRTENANETIAEILSAFKFSKPQATLHKVLVKNLLKGDNKGRGRRSGQLKKVITTQDERIEQLRDKLLDGIIASEDFTLMKTRYMRLKQEAEEELVSMTGDVTGKSILLKKALNAVSELGNSYFKAGPDAISRLLSSIFPEMIEFDGNKCRTPKINEAILLCLNADKGFGGNKSGKLHEKLEVSRLVEPTGQISNHWSDVLLLGRLNEKD